VNNHILSVRKWHLFRLYRPLMPTPIGGSRLNTRHPEKCRPPLLAGTGSALFPISALLVRGQGAAHTGTMLSPTVSPPQQELAQLRTALLAGRGRGASAQEIAAHTRDRRWLGALSTCRELDNVRPPGDACPYRGPIYLLQRLRTVSGEHGTCSCRRYDGGARRAFGTPRTTRQATCRIRIAGYLLRSRKTCARGRQLPPRTQRVIRDEVDIGFPLGRACAGVVLAGASRLCADRCRARSRIAGPERDHARPVPRPGGPEAARSFLSSITTSMISVTGVVFSITIVALQLAAGQFSSRVTRDFLRDRTTQHTFGVFVGTFTYAMEPECDVLFIGGLSVQCDVQHHHFVVGPAPYTASKGAPWGTKSPGRGTRTQVASAPAASRMSASALIDTTTPGCGERRYRSGGRSGSAGAVSVVNGYRSSSTARVSRPMRATMLATRMEFAMWLM